MSDLQKGTKKNGSASIVEKTRQRIRKLLPMSLYRQLAFIYDCIVLVKKGEISLLKAYINRSSAEKYRVYVRSINKEVVLRGNSPDMACVVQNLIREEYSFAKKSKDPIFMIDAGGYIGDTALYLHKVHPNAKLIVLEPELNNYEICSDNLKSEGSIELLHAGLGAKSGFMNVEGTFWSVTSSKVDHPSKTTSSIPVTTIDDILRCHGANNLDILKMDIEGAETEVLNDRSAEWPQKTKMILVETHGKESELSVSNFANHYLFKVFDYRSITILLKNEGINI